MTGPQSAVHLPSPYRLVQRDEVDSTNAEAKRLAAEGAPDSTIVWARRQTKGRGRRGRTWVSPEGNLYFSILLRPPYPARDVMQLGFVTANAVADALQVAAPRGTFVNVKWPNDVLMEGKKAAGILLEAEPDPDKPISQRAQEIRIRLIERCPTVGDVAEFGLRSDPTPLADPRQGSGRAGHGASGERNPARHFRGPGRRRRAGPAPGRAGQPSHHGGGRVFSAPRMILHLRIEVGANPMGC